MWDAQHLQPHKSPGPICTNMLYLCARRRSVLLLDRMYFGHIVVCAVHSTSSFKCWYNADIQSETYCDMRRNLMPTFVDRGVSHGHRGGSAMVVNLFSRPELLLFFQVAPHSSSQGLSGPSSSPTATQKIW
jgi:hypothetical protein